MKEVYISGVNSQLEEMKGSYWCTTKKKRKINLVRRVFLPNGALRTRLMQNEQEAPLLHDLHAG